ncbi:MAG: hypothetical protein JNN17_18135 [Verrucomicrobiaceae bacterium]|nr:hypothetical protein [Verrucomicrobiaceae bacterium]
MVTHLFIKQKQGAPLLASNSLMFDANGIAGGVQCLPLRQVLIVPTRTMKEFGVEAEVLRANIIVEFDNLHNLRSGTVLQIGEALIRLTFHCESCDKLRPFILPSKIAHNRGFLGLFLNGGKIRVGDPITVVDTRYEEIPFNPTERIRWYLRSAKAKVASKTLLENIGFSRSYARVLPRWLAPLTNHERSMITWSSKGAK